MCAHACVCVPVCSVSSHDLVQTATMCGMCVLTLLQGKNVVTEASKALNKAMRAVGPHVLTLSQKAKVSKLLTHTHRHAHTQNTNTV